MTDLRRCLRIPLLHFLFRVSGIISSADDWVLNSPINSPGFLLSDAGYDVWLINTRGTPYSKHLKHKRNSKPFWDFSFGEIGLFDVPAAIDFVLQHTGHPQLTILGWSQGTTDIMVTLSLKPQYNHKVGSTRDFLKKTS